MVATARNMEKLRAACADANDKLALVQLDISDQAQAKASNNEAAERFGRIDVLINNAGNSVLDNFEGMSAADIRRQFDVNFFGGVSVLLAALPVMRRCVEVSGALYVRTYSGTQSTWYQVAVREKAGRITAAGMTHNVKFETVAGSVNHPIEDAYSAQYKGSQYLAPMISERSRAATVRIIPTRNLGSA